MGEGEEKEGKGTKGSERKEKGGERRKRRRGDRMKGGEGLE